MEQENNRPTVKHAVFLAALLLAAAGTPLLAAWVLHVATLPANSYEYVSTGILTGMLVGGLAGIRSRSLAQLFIGPTVGILAGTLDLRVLGWLVGRLEWPVAAAWCVPTYGLVLGLWVATSRQRWGSALLTVVAIAGADCVSRLAWDVFILHTDSLPADWQQLRWLLAAVPYVMPAVLAVLLTRPGQGETAGTVTSAPAADSA